MCWFNVVSFQQCEVQHWILFTCLTFLTWSPVMSVHVVSLQTWLKFLICTVLLSLKHYLTLDFNHFYFQEDSWGVSVTTTDWRSLSVYVFVLRGSRGSICAAHCFHFRNKYSDHPERLSLFINPEVSLSVACFRVWFFWNVKSELKSTLYVNSVYTPHSLGVAILRVNASLSRYTQY